MFTRKFFPIILLISFVMALALSIFLLKPSAPHEPVQVSEIEPPQSQPSQQTALEPISSSIEEPAKNPVKKPTTANSTLSAELQAVKDGKSSIISTIFNSDNLNAQFNELLALSEQGEAWADFAIGQVAEMCGYLYETPETQLIAMFTNNGRTVSPEQQTQMSQLLPVVLDASKRCKTMDGEQLKKIGNPRDWFDKAAAANHAGAFVTRGYSLISKRMREEIELAPDATEFSMDTQLSSVQEKAKVEYLTTMRDHFAQGRVNPETLMSMSEHLNLFYENEHPYKSKEAWMLLACDKGYEKGCSQNSKMMSLFCMFDSSCQSGGDLQQGIVWEQGQFSYDQYRRTADELKQILDTKDWERLGF